MSGDKLENLVRDIKSRKIPAPVKQAVLSMLDKKAEKVVVLKLKGLNDITDFMVICSGQSTRQNHAIFEEIKRKLKKGFKLKAFSVEGGKEADWILMDYIDFIVHIFSEETRGKYALEKMWMDAKRYDFILDWDTQG